MLRWLTAGESHGEALTGVLEGVPAGVGVTTEDLAGALGRRRLGYGRGARMSFEADRVTLIGGVRHGVTMGSPVALRIDNTEWPKWQAVMSADPVPPESLQVDAGRGDEREVARNRPLTRPRPGHADLAGMQKYGLDEARPVLERASARETAARVALGEVARQALGALGIELGSHVVALGGVHVPDGALDRAALGDLTTDGGRARIDADPVRCGDPATAATMVERVDEAKRAGDTLGGVVEVLAAGLPPGLGSHVHGDRRLDAQLAGALMSIQAIKGVELGDGFDVADQPGSAAHDEMEWDEGAIRRVTDRSGGVEGGMSTGELLRVRAAMKPISTVPRALRTVDLATGEAATAHHQRSDVCAVPAAGVVAEAEVALVLLRAVLEKFGGDHLEDTQAAVQHYRRRLAGMGGRP
ncbi:chorismate synthase [Kytococcus sedentarius]|uniref:chorismate synthase n=1 Tax=Kytococcus sedentarius TaxID=1276 RepID=UPI00384EE6C0